MSESFWDFSVRTYRTNKVPEACLLLQDERGIDVNMLLYCAWFGFTRGHMEENTFQAVFEFSETWAKRVVRPLRHVRTWMKLEGCMDPRMPAETCMALREKVKGVEFTAEKIQQDVLESLAPAVAEKNLTLPVQLNAMAGNIHQYINAVNIVADKFMQENLQIILGAAVTNLTANEICTALTHEF